MLALSLLSIPRSLFDRANKQTPTTRFAPKQAMYQDSFETSSPGDGDSEGGEVDGAASNGDDCSPTPAPPSPPPPPVPKTVAEKLELVKSEEAELLRQFGETHKRSAQASNTGRCCDECSSSWSLILTYILEVRFLWSPCGGWLLGYLLPRRYVAIREPFFFCNSSIVVPACNIEQKEKAKREEMAEFQRAGEAALRAIQEEKEVRQAALSSPAPTVVGVFVRLVYRSCFFSMSLYVGSCNR